MKADIYKQLSDETIQFMGDSDEIVSRNPLVRVFGECVLQYKLNDDSKRYGLIFSDVIICMDNNIVSDATRITFVDDDGTENAKPKYCDMVISNYLGNYISDWY